jgi:hypothetical protein
MSTYLSRHELAELLECAETSYATMARKLSAMKWPHVYQPGHPPKVARVVHDAIMRGESLVVTTQAARRPRFEALQ